jgi:hypothetical protein
MKMGILLQGMPETAVVVGLGKLVVVVVGCR